MRSVSDVTQAEVGAPGVVVGVSLDGSLVWSEGLYQLFSLLWSVITTVKTNFF